MTEHVNIEFIVGAGKRQPLIDALQALDEQGLLPCEGYRADDYVQRREALTKFVTAMELKLRKNDHKTSWRLQPIEALYRLLKIEMMEFEVADEFLTVNEARNELVDVANFALILFDRLSLIQQDRNRHEQQAKN